MAQFSEEVSGPVGFSLFQLDQSNILVNDDRDAAVALGWSSLDAGEARSRGIEIDADLAFEGGFDLWLSYAYIDAAFTNSNPDADFGATIEAGDPLINSPAHQASLQVSQGFEAAGMPAQVGGGVQYTDSRLGWTAFDFTLPSYTTARFFGQIRPTERLTLRFDLDNVFDELYYTNSHADVWVEPGAPRRYRLSLAVNF